MFSDLKVWRDLDSDGVTDSGELQSLSDAGVASLNLSYTNGSTVDGNGNGNTHRQLGSYADVEGETHDLTDVWFSVDPTRTTPVTSVDVPEEIQALPDAQGFGNVRSLHETMALDESGTLLAVA